MFPTNEGDIVSVHQLGNLTERLAVVRGILVQYSLSSFKVLFIRYLSDIKVMYQLATAWTAGECSRYKASIFLVNSVFSHIAYRAVV